ncbi:hypothetical protein NDU88_000868 [Pleurodeles waltl]|uniref:Uncharacterized protein n=1 Tax=Pleurodeles waltl TaxID=8319 RepID=A0AAV7LYS8_PLEWA|nr:hypothetical protein NDU88_000868 [Pleurodeles waltl]
MNADKSVFYPISAAWARDENMRTTREQTTPVNYLGVYFAQQLCCVARKRSQIVFLSKLLARDLVEVRPLGTSPLSLTAVAHAQTLKHSATVSMAQQDDYYGEYTEGYHMEERLVEALGYQVQDSVNKTLRPFAQPIFNFGRRRFGAGSGNPTPNDVEINEPGRSDIDPLEYTINTV